MRFCQKNIVEKKYNRGGNSKTNLAQGDLSSFCLIFWPKYVCLLKGLFMLWIT
jgi:hypothetical protein